MKDTENKLSYNTWSGTDYNEDTTNWNTGLCTCISSTDYSNTGEHSLKATGTLNQYFDVDRITLSGGVEVSANVVVYNPDSTVRVSLRSYSSTLCYVDVSASDTPQLISLSGTTTSNEWVTIRTLIKSSTGTVYMDNPLLTY